MQVTNKIGENFTEVYAEKRYVRLSLNITGLKETKTETISVKLNTLVSFIIGGNLNHQNGD